MSLVCSTFIQPSLLVLCLAGSIRNAAGYVWAYNTQIYFQDIGTSAHVIAKYMSWIPLVWGCIGVVLGGFIADRVVKRVGVYARVCVLIASQALAVPFVAGALYFNPPLAFMSLIPAYIVGEMWVGITLAVVVEVVPIPLRTTAVAVYMFVISNVGGNMPLLVPPLKNSFQRLGWDPVSSLRAALYVLYPGLYILGTVLFVAALVTLRWDLRRRQNSDYQPVPTDS
jgi:MFS family permease